ncbi:MAG: cell division protein SepF [Kocuria sp.]|nr:cell division protein SepF [Kocuria sp.]
MGQSMRRAMIALGLAVPDPQSESRSNADHDAAHTVSQGDRDERIIDHSESRPGLTDEASGIPRSLSEDADRGDRSGDSVRELREDTSVTHSSRPRIPHPRRSAEYRAPVTPIKRAPSTTREIADDMRTITTVHPRSYNDAKSVGESFRDGTPVIMDLTDLGEAEAKRLVDFAAGLVYALHGSIERVTTTVFLLTPSYVEVVDTTVAPADDADADQA